MVRCCNIPRGGHFQQIDQGFQIDLVYNGYHKISGEVKEFGVMFTDNVPVHRVLNGLHKYGASTTHLTPVACTGLVVADNSLLMHAGDL